MKLTAKQSSRPKSKKADSSARNLYFKDDVWALIETRAAAENRSPSNYLGTLALKDATTAEASTKG